MRTVSCNTFCNYFAKNLILWDEEIAEKIIEKVKGNTQQQKSKNISHF